MYDPSILIWSKDLGKLDIQLWHIDPETDGTDNSCGWFKPRLTEEQKKIIGKDLDFIKKCTIEIYKIFDDNHRYHIILAMYRQIVWNLYKRDMNIKEHIHVIELVFNYFDGLTIDRDFESIYWNLATLVLKEKRKWYQHPKWHIKHWCLRLKWGKNKAIEIGKKLNVDFY